VRREDVTTSTCVSDPTFKDDLKLMLTQYKFSVIHFNNGLQGWGYTEDQYRDGLSKTVVAVKEDAGDAKLIWATTTPVREKQAFYLPRVALLSGEVARGQSSPRKFGVGRFPRL
jgi:hypothetical protein